MRSTLDERQELLEYEEKQGCFSSQLGQWRSAPTLPPPLQEVIATDGYNVKEAWISGDNKWMRINATWERVFGSSVIAWMEKPAPPDRRRGSLREDHI